MLAAGRGMLAQLLAADPGYRGPRVPCGAGHQAEFVSCRDKVIGTVLGPVTLTRAWYHCADCKHGLAPRDAELGVAGASMPPGLAAMNDLAAAAGPFAGAARLLQELAGVRLDASRAGRAAEASGAAVAAAGRERERAALIASRTLVPLPPSPLPDKLYAVIDRATTSIIATFEPAAAFAGLVRAEGIRRGADHVRQLTVLGDGAPWIWGIATGKFPEATQIAGLYHAREHLHSLTRSLEFMLLDRKDEWLAARLEDLDYGDIDGIKAAVRKYPLEGVKKDEVEKELGYFLGNAPRMRYHWFRSRGLFVGSGVVEASCKTIVAQRLKQAGMHWTAAGADAIIALRCKEASNHWEAICDHRHNQTGAA